MIVLIELAQLPRADDPGLVPDDLTDAGRALSQHPVAASDRAPREGRMRSAALVTHEAAPYTHGGEVISVQFS